MRFKSKTKGGYTVYAVAGTNTASFAIDFTKADTKGLLGFSVQRTYAPDDKFLYMPGFKVFEDEFKKDTGKKPTADVMVSTQDHPVQSFVWDDFTLKPGQQYTYRFSPVTGEPGALTEGAYIEITIQTEAIFAKDKHDIFFNRGVASSQAYAREFHNAQPDELVGKEKQDAFDWLGRDLDKALYKFIGQAGEGDTLLACYYEFHYQPVLDAFKQAIDRGADVRIIIDAKENGTDGEGEDANGNAKKAKDPFPRQTNLDTIKAAKIPMKNVIKREHNPNAIQHNKFMVYLKGGKLSKDSAVFTGSVNLSENGIYGHTNVGHWVRGDKTVAEAYMNYWNLLSKDPGAEKGGDRSDNSSANKAYKADVVELTPDVTSTEFADGITCIFSPRPTDDMLLQYFQLIKDAKSSSAITLAFGVNAELKDLLLTNNAQSAVTFMLLEKQDKPNARSTKEFTPLTAANNVYEAFGSYLKDPLYNWVQETNAQQMNMHADHVVYIHSKFLIQDALGDSPVVVTGSANFSGPSTVTNDENMIIVKGDTRVADIYFTEFNRLFNHYYFRSIAQLLDKGGKAPASSGLFLDTTDGWLKNYTPGKLRRKRVDIYVQMKGTQTL